MINRVFVTCLVVMLYGATGFAAPSIKVLPTTQSVEKGGVFQIRVEISTTEPIKNISVVPIVPDGFLAEPMVTPGVKTDKDGTAILIDHLDAGSAITISFKAWPPGFMGKPRKGDKEAPYSTRGEPKSFIFNVFYTDLTGKIEKSQTASINIRYTTSIGFYLLFGMLGVVIGHVVKMGTQNRTEISSAMAGNAAVPPRARTKLKIASGYIFVSRLPALLTLLVVGFAALLTLSKETIPVTGWHQAMALGIGLAILTDEQLLAKIKP